LPSGGGEACLAFMSDGTLRSPHARLGGLVHLPRLLDKLRAEARGLLPEAYAPLLGKGFDARVCAFLGIDYGALRDAVQAEALDDEAVLAWCRARTTWPGEEALEVFNEFMRKRGWNDDLSPRLCQMSDEMGLDDEGSLQCAFDVLDADEGRPRQAAATDRFRLPPLADSISLFQRHATPLQPLATGETARLPRLEGIRAVLFDLYGTLFISATGDISLAEAGDRDGALRATLEAAGIVGLPRGLPLAERFHEVLRAAQDRRRAEGIAFPEVEIREVWHHFLAELAADGLSFEQPSRRGLARLALDYECRVNPVWPMPSAGPTLSTLRQRGLRLGIVSNAQFYTRFMFPAFLGGALTDLGFDRESCVFSYREREGKPSTALFARVAKVLARDGIPPEAVLFVGNDRRNDLWPAARAGFHTALFAGDARSLRWREGDPDLTGVEPEAIVTDLWQIIQMLPE
jgi:putative hydrolase of the HAD superfamily